MPRNNIKLLTEEQLVKLDYQYMFDYNEKNRQVVVKCRNYFKDTPHSIDEPFSVNSKIRKVTFTPEAMAIWIELRKEHKVNLLCVQQAVNMLQITFRDVSKTAVLETIKNTDYLKIKCLHS